VLTLESDALIMRILPYRTVADGPIVVHVCLHTVHKFKVIYGEIFKPAPLWNLQWPAILGAMGLGFCLSLLFFMDQNIAGAMVNSPDNRYDNNLWGCRWDRTTCHKCQISHLKKLAIAE